MKRLLKKLFDEELVENLSKVIIDLFPSQLKRKKKFKKFYKETEQTLSKEMQDELEPIPMKPTIIHTRTFSCSDDHPIVFYTFDETNKAMCEYCSTHFIYEESQII